MRRKTNKLNRNILLVMEVFMTLVILVGAIQIECASAKIVKTAVDLAVLNDNARFYNEQSVKTDKMTAEYLENQKIRNEEFYNSEDSLVHWYSNTKAKVVFLLLAVVLMFIPVAVFLVVFEYVRRQKEIKILQKRNERLERISKNENQNQEELLEWLIDLYFNNLSSKKD